MAIGQRLPIFCLGKDRMLVANVLVAPDAFIKSVRFTDVTGPAPITYGSKNSESRFSVNRCIISLTLARIRSKLPLPINHIRDSVLTETEIASVKYKFYLVEVLESPPQRG